MQHALTLCALAFLMACAGSDKPSSSSTPEGSGANIWSDAELWAVLDAQDHRDVPGLLRFLEHQRPDVREHAALAFASSPDSAALSALIKALKDPEPLVRKAVAVAIGNASDSSAWAALSTASDAERDTSVLRVMLEEAFKARVELKLVKDPEQLFQLLNSGNVAIRTRAAQQLARMPSETMAPLETKMLEAAGRERDATVRMFLVASLKHFRSDKVKDALMDWGSRDSLPSIRVSAIRALGAREDDKLQGFFLDRMNDGVQAVRFTAVEQLERMKGPLDADAIWKVGQVQGDAFTQLPLYGLVLKHGRGGTRMIARKLLEAQAALDNMDYAEAAILRAQANDSLPFAWASVREALKEGRPLLVRTTALELALALPGIKPAEKQDPGSSYVDLLRDALRSKDAGMIAMAADEIAGAEWAPRFSYDLLEPLTAAQASLDLPLDQETWLAIARAVAQVKGKVEPAHTQPAWNHPIVRDRLMALRQGQQYRIMTNKGEIVLALEVDAAPGSCLAFDSLVTAGYYSGKFFHRVIPNFVAQGGCPRGDGWGGMDWTLRTEIGYDGFTTSAVGLASAGRDTESCQFFIMLAPAPHLDGKYTRFAHVLSGMDLVQQLQVGDRMVSVEKVPE